MLAKFLLLSSFLVSLPYALATSAPVACVLKYEISIEDPRVSASNLGVAQVECNTSPKPTVVSMRFLAYNTRPWTHPGRERGSLGGLGVDLNPQSFLQVLLHSPPGRQKQKHARRGTDGSYLYATVLMAPGLYQDDVSARIEEGTLDGFALSRGFDTWVFFAPSTSEFNTQLIPLYNPHKIVKDNRYENCKELRTPESAHECFGLHWQYSFDVR